MHGLVVLNTLISLKTWLRERGIRQRAVSTERDKRETAKTGSEAKGRGNLLASRCSARSRRHPAGRIHTARVQITDFGFRLFAAES